MAGIRRPIKASKRLGLSATPSMRGLAVSGTHLYIGNLLSTNTYVGTHGTITVVSGFLRQANLPAAGGVDTILGVCEDDTGLTTDSTTYVRFVPALPHVIFEGSMDNGSGTGTCEDTQVFQSYNVKYDATNHLWYIDVTAPYGAVPNVRVVGLVDDAGTQAGRVEFTFIPSTTTLGTGA